MTDQQDPVFTDDFRKDFEKEIVLPRIKNFVRDTYWSHKTLAYEPEAWSPTFCNAFNKWNEPGLDLYKGQLFSFKITSHKPYVELFRTENPEILLELQSKLEEALYLKITFWVGLIAAAVLTSGSEYFYLVLLFGAMPIIIGSSSIIKRIIYGIN